MRVFLADVALQPQHADVGVLIDEPFVVADHSRIQRPAFETRAERSALIGAEISRPVVARQDQAKTVTTDFAGRLHRDVRIDDRARVHGRDSRLENVDAFKEERTLFRKEDRKPLIGGDDKLISFDLREVGIDRQIESYSRTGNELERETRVETKVVVHDPAGVS